MADSFATELREIIDRAYTVELGGRATHKMVHAHTQGSLPDHVVDYLVGKGLAAEVALYFREKNSDGLPKRPAVNSDGEHVQLAFLTVEECGFVYDAYRSRADANREKADKVRDFCLEQHGVDLAAAVVAS